MILSHFLRSNNNCDKITTMAFYRTLYVSPQKIELKKGQAHPAEGEHSYVVQSLDKPYKSSTLDLIQTTV